MYIAHAVHYGNSNSTVLMKRDVSKEKVPSLLTKYAIYGPNMPIKFEPIVPIDRPVWRKHVGYVSIACKLMTKKVMAAQNLTIIVEKVE